MSVVSYSISGNVGIISINNPPVNALSHALRSGLVGAIAQAQNDTSKALIIICEGRTFMAGADITEFGKPPQLPSLPDMLDSIEKSEKPVIAAIHGTALGGGFETALACDYRCAITSAQVGLPEVNLGLLPGAGGTQRTPRLAGIDAALEMISSGRPISATKAEQLGLIDSIITGTDLHAAALEYAESLISDDIAKRKVSEINISPDSFSPDVFDSYRKTLSKRARGQNAPQRIVDCVYAAATLPFQEGIAKEREQFLECMNDPQSAALRHLFFSEREAAKVAGLSKDTVLRPIESVAIIGGGTMGGGIAMNFINKGIPVTLLEINDEALQRGLDIIAKNYAITVSKGKLSEQQASAAQALITGATDYQQLANADLVIEAVFENLEVKQQVFAKLDTVCKAGTILASNTSYQDINAIAEATSRPQDVIGLHFFSPANVMKLLEVVRADKSADDAIATAMKLAKNIGKVPVLAGPCYGFIGNRMLRPYGREAQLCLIEGASAEQIDSAMENWGMAMGPLAMSDLAGLDIGYKAREQLSDEEKGDPKTYRVADALVEAGRLGQKSGSGYYRYDAQTRARNVDPFTAKLVEKEASTLAVNRRPFSDEEIVERMVLALINEGAKILQDGIAQRPSDIDVVYVYGYSFPKFRGGPMFYADQLGLKKVYQRICEFCDELDADNWQPAELIKTLAEQNSTFAQWNANK